MLRESGSTARPEMSCANSASNPNAKRHLSGPKPSQIVLGAFRIVQRDLSVTFAGSTLSIDLFELFETLGVIGT
jgi:hypothetical protein